MHKNYSWLYLALLAPVNWLFLAIRIAGQRHGRCFLLR
jgi:hypothetical protein